MKMINNDEELRHQFNVEHMYVAETQTTYNCQWQ